MSFSKLQSKQFLLLLSFLLLSFGFFLWSDNHCFSIVRFLNRTLSIHLTESFWGSGFSYISTLLIYFGIVTVVFFLYRSGKISRKQFGVISIVLFVIHYFFYLVKNSYNYPVYDDHGAILEFLNHYTRANSLQEKVKLLLAPFWESRITVPRIFILITWKIFHEINFQYLVWFDAVLLLSFHFLLMKKLLQGQPDCLFYILGLTFLALQFQAYNSIFCDLSGLCYNGVLLFALLSFYFLKSGKKIAPIILAIAATLTFGNGLWIFPLSILYLWNQKRRKEIFLWLIVLVIIIVANIYSRTSFDVYNGVSFHFINFILFIPGVLGSAFQFLYTMHIPVAMGCFVITVFVISLLKKWYVSSPVIFMMLAFLVISAVSAAPFRSGIIPNGEYALQVRYGIFSVYSIILALAILIENTSLRQGKRYFMILFFGFGYNLLTGLFFYPEVVVRTKRVQILLEETQHGKYIPVYSIYKEKEYEELISESVAKGIYKPR